jgi:hypothetical protein
MACPYPSTQFLRYYPIIGIKVLADRPATTTNESMRISFGKIKVTAINGIVISRRTVVAAVMIEGAAATSVIPIEVIINVIIEIADDLNNHDFEKCSAFSFFINFTISKTNKKILEDEK